MKSSLLQSLFDETERRPLTVSELTAQVRGVIENRFSSVWIEGEISNFRAHTSGHWYFTIKDETAQLRATCFRGVNSRIRFRPSDGLLVRARGRLTVYEPRGEYELCVEALDPVGAGALRIAFEQLRDRLQREGLFAEELKRPLPLLPRCIGIVTSASGAAISDILHVIKRRTRTVHILFAPARVQGEGAGHEIAEALRLLNEHHANALRDGRMSETVDAIIVGRGGGSIEDLWAFNEEEVARAIRASVVPVISAVGHETDYTIADFAADLRAPTPSAAAEMVATREDELLAHTEDLTRDLVRRMRFRILHDRTRVQEAAMSPGFDQTRARLGQAAQKVDEAGRRLAAVMTRAIERTRRRTDAATQSLSPARMATRAARARVRLAVGHHALDAAAASQLDVARQRLAVAVAALDALSPLAVLQRGYALAQNEAGTLLRSTRSVSVGDSLRLQLAEGAVRCRVEGVEQVEQAESA